MIREMYAVNYVNILSGNASSDHVHMPISVPPHLSVSKVVYIKKKSSRKLQGEFQELRKRYWEKTSVGKGIFCSNIRAANCKGGTRIYRGARGTS